MGSVNKQGTHNSNYPSQELQKAPQLEQSNKQRPRQ
jgi:hypothetical protein